MITRALRRRRKAVRNTGACAVRVRVRADICPRRANFHARGAIVRIPALAVLFFFAEKRLSDFPRGRGVYPRALQGRRPQGGAVPERLPSSRNGAADLRRRVVL